MDEKSELRWRIRPSGAGDFEAVMGLYDEAVIWLNERGITEQWGVTPVSSRPHLVAEIQGYLNDATVVENDASELLGLIAVAFPAPEAAESNVAYIHSIVSRRTPDARGAGAALLQWAEETAKKHGLNALRMARWENNPKLVAYYQNLGFITVENADRDRTITLLEKRFG